MKAVVMAGGEGTRLRPLTCNIPKPMARLCGRPVLCYILDLLAQNGVDEVYLTLKYLPQEVTSYFNQGNYCGMQLHFVEEEIPLGTAGGVKKRGAGLSGAIFSYQWGCTVRLSIARGGGLPQRLRCAGNACDCTGGRPA